MFFAYSHLKFLCVKYYIHNLICISLLGVYFNDIHCIIMEFIGGGVPVPSRSFNTRYHANSLEHIVPHMPLQRAYIYGYLFVTSINGVE